MYLNGAVEWAHTGKRIMPKRKATATAKLVKELRANLDLTQEQFAVEVGVTWSTVNRWENGKGKPSPLAMRQIEKLQTKSKKH